MSIKTLMFRGFFLTAGLLIAGVTWQAAKAQRLKMADCNTKLSSGKTYVTHHQGQFQQGQTLGISGGIEITQTYKCTWGTCFRANMKLVDYSVGVNKAEGYWQGSNLQFTRYVGTENTPESWSGQCLENAITNNCYFPNSPNKKYLFTITY